MEWRKCAADGRPSVLGDQEDGFLEDGLTGGVIARELNLNRNGVTVLCVLRDLNPERNGPVGGSVNRDLSRGSHSNPGDPGDGYVKSVRVLVRIHQLQSIDILDPIVFNESGQRRTVANHIDPERIAHSQRRHPEAENAEKDRCVDKRSGP